jgi:hypothetical protein
MHSYQTKVGAIRPDEERFESTGVFCVSDIDSIPYLRSGGEAEFLFCHVVSL